MRGLDWLAVVAIVLQGATARAQEPDWAKLPIVATEVAPGLHMVEGQGGNLGVVTGADGVFVIDDQYAPLSGRLLEAIRTLSDKPLRFVLNTHWHFDHSDGNESFAAAGAVLVAQQNARQRLERGQFIAFLQRQVPPAPAAALPVITFSEEMNFYLDGQDVHVFHVPAAHTDGDSVVHFPGLNAVHMGDTFFHGMYPFIDGSSGGSVAGVLAAMDRVLALADADTRIIPGHGKLATRAQLEAARAMLATVSGRIEAQVKKGATKEAIVASKPTAEFDVDFSGGFITADMWVGMLVDLLSAPAAG